MKQKGFDNKYNDVHHQRFQQTQEFLKGILHPDDRILDLGPENPFSDILKKQGFKVTNTPEDMDLDFDFEIVKKDYFDVVTAFEILEHLVSPFPLLCAIKAQRLVVSVPLRLWFARAYWNENDIKDRHFHEFEPRQFDMLLDKSGWQIVKSQKLILTTRKIGIRPLLRNFTPRIYLVYCERKK